MSNNFTTWDLVAGNDKSPVCSACEGVFRDFKFRNRSLYADHTRVSDLGRTDLSAIITEPPRFPYAVTWPASRKKHCWLYAEASDRETLRFGCDDRTAVVSIAEARDALQTISDLLRVGATKTEVRTGQYRPQIARKFGSGFDRIEGGLAPLRSAATLPILIWCCEQDFAEVGGDDVMLSAEDRLAAELIGRLANGSGMRDRDPVSFWGTNLLSRVKRRSGAGGLSEFVEALSEEIGVRSPDLRETIIWIESLGESEEQKMLSRIKAAPRIVVAYAQEEARRLRAAGGAKAGQAAPIDNLHSDLATEKMQ
ncbi:MAG: hypothetical protein ACTHJ3_08020 [Pararhizobium sp.]